MFRRHFISKGLGLAVAGLFPIARGAKAAESPSTSVPPPQWVRLPFQLPPFEVHVFPDAFRLYWTMPGKRAWEYAIRIGRDDLYEAGSFYVGAKKEWPSWTPTPDMIEREPEKYERYAEDGMPGGVDNPLGARALYLFQEGRGDTFLRIHGTNDPETIGRAVSNGCAGLINEQMITLYDQVPEGTRVTLNPKLNASG